MTVELCTADALLVALLMVALPACNIDSRSGNRSNGSSRNDSSSEGSPPLATTRSIARDQPREAKANKREGAALPELRAEYIRSVQARADATYRVEPTAAKLLRMRNAAQGLLAEYSPDGVKLTSTARRGASGGLALAGFGCEQQRAAVHAAVPRAEGNRVEYARGDLLEWYVNGPLGLAQGFTLAAPPPCSARGGGPVVAELAVRGPLRPELVAQGARVELRSSTGRGVFTYSDLFARDAAGRTVAATITVAGKRLLLHVDDAGATYPLQIDALLSTQQAKLLASDGEAYDTFGASVAVSGDTALVGAKRDDDNGSDAGAAYVFVRSGTGWTQQAKLTAAHGAADDNFGVAVALSGDTALVGSMFDDGAGSDAGAAYVFIRRGTSWTQQAKLTAADAAPDDQLGSSVALSGDTALVGTGHNNEKGHHAGSAYVFVRNSTSWTQQAKLTAADAAPDNNFGISVAVSEDTALVGAYGDDDLGSRSGSAYAFVRRGTSWTQQAKLLAADGAATDQFGVSAAVSGDTALVGANLDDDHGADSGSAYVFVRDGTRWTQQAKLTASDGVDGDNFGTSVAVLGDKAVVGMPNDNVRGAGSGSAYVFVRSGTSWARQAKLTAPDGTSADLFGTSVVLSESSALVGAPGDDDLGSSSGSAYVYTSTSSNTDDAYAICPGACRTGS